MDKPLLSIGIIFKNESRCLERCLRALDPLRKAIPCELVMADTGSADGSREVAEKYADILIDFPWIHDFAAARNAVRERCSGKWLFSVDCDEYLQPDISELVDFLNTSYNSPIEACAVVQRNYFTSEMDGDYGDFLAGRLFRLSSKARWVGAIHEAWMNVDGRPLNWGHLTKTILDHDGYVGLNVTEAGKEKIKRNLELLRQELKAGPDDLRRLTQFIECGKEEAEIVKTIRHAVCLVRQRRGQWERYGPSILRHGVSIALAKNMPEIEEWIPFAAQMFPKSYFTRIDVAAYAFSFYWNTKEDYAACIHWGKMYMEGCKDLDNNPYNEDTSRGVLDCSRASIRQQMCAFLAGAYIKEGKIDRGLSYLNRLDAAQMDAQGAAGLAGVLGDLQAGSSVNTVPLVKKLWKELTAPIPSEKRARERQRSFVQRGNTLFKESFRRTEQEKPDFHRPAYTVFLPLKDECELGRAAVLLDTDNPGVMDNLLEQVELWGEFPASALFHALEAGVQFPPANRAINAEDMENLAMRLSREQENYLELVWAALACGSPEDWRDLAWMQALVWSAVGIFDWSAKGVNIEQGINLARGFADVERNFLPFFYSGQVLEESKLSLLPDIHRFGFYCAQAFEKLDAGDFLGYVHLLRDGLTACERMGPLVQFLTEHLGNVSSVQTMSELHELAEKIQSLIASYLPDDPALVKLKSSPEYRRVAYLLENPEEKRM